MTLLLHNIPMTHPAFGDVRWGNGKSEHHAVMSLFGHIDPDVDQQHSRAAADVLYRTEPHAAAPDGTTGRVLVQSNRPLAADHGTAVRTTDLAAHIDTFTVGAPVRLLLRGNTVRTINCTCDGNSPRPPQPRPGVPVHTHRVRVPDDRLPLWLAGRLDGAVALDTTTVTVDLPDGTTTDVTVPAVKNTRTDTRIDRRAQLIRNDLHATGAITDPAELRQLCTDGVGRGKAYGCGMLTVVPG